MLTSDSSFHRHHAGRPIGRFIKPDQTEDALEMSNEGFPQRCVLCLPVIGLVRQGDPTLLNEDDVALGVTWIVIDKQLEETINSLSLERTEQHR